MKKRYLSVFCVFDDDKSLHHWMQEHVINQAIPTGGPVFSYSSENESVYRDLYNELKEKNYG